MARVRTSAISGGTSGTGNRTVAITAAIGDLIIVFGAVSGVSAAATCSDTGTGGTYTSVLQKAFNSSADACQVFVRDNLVTAAGSITVTYTTGSNVSAEVCAVAVAEMSKAGATAILQSTGQANQAAGGTPAPVFTNAPKTYNLILAAVGSDNTSAGPTKPTTFTLAQSAGQINNNIWLAVASQNNAFTNTTVTWGSTCATVFGSLAVELDATPFSHIQGAAGSGVTVATVNVVLGATPKQGNLICSGLALGTNVTAVTCKDSNNNSYTVIGPSTNGANIQCYSAYLLSAPSNATATITWAWTTNSSCAVWADEFDPCGTTIKFDTSATGTGASGTTINSPSITPATSSSLLWAIAASGGTISAPVGGALGTATKLGSWWGSGGAITNGDMAEYGLALSGSTAVNFTQSTAAWAAIAMSFVDVGGAAVITGTAAEVAPLTGVGALADVIAASAAVVAPLTGAGALADVISASAVVAAPLLGTGALADVITGSAAVVAPLLGSGALLSGITGVGSLNIVPWSFVSRAAGSGSGTATAAFSPSTTAGNILLALMRFPATSTFTSLGDGVNTWTLVGSEAQTDASTNKYRLYMAKAVGGAATVSAVASAGTVTVGIMEFGAAGEWSLVASSQTPDNQNSVTTWGTFNSAVSVGDHDLLVAFMSQDAARTVNSPDNQGNTVTTFSVNTIFEAHILNTTRASTTETGSYASGSTRAIQFLLDFQLSIDASLTGFASIAALLAGAGALADGITGSATIVAPLTGTGALADVITGTSAVVAPLTGTGALADVILGTSSVAALLKGAGELDGVITATSSVVAPLTGAGALADVILGSAVVVAPLLGAGALADVINGTSSVVAPLTGSGALAGVISATSSIAALLAGTGALLDVIAGTSSVVALAAGAGVLVDNITGSASVTVPGTGTGALADDINGTSSVAALLAASGALAGVIAGSGIVSATGQLLVFITSDIVGVGSLEIVNHESIAASIIGSSAVVADGHAIHFVSANLFGNATLAAILGGTADAVSAITGYSVMRAGVIDSLIVQCLQICETVLSVADDIILPPDSAERLATRKVILNSCVAAIRKLIEDDVTIAVSARQVFALTAIFQAMQATQVLLQLASYLTPGTSPDTLWVHTKSTLQQSYDALLHNYGLLISLDTAAAGIA